MKILTFDIEDWFHILDNPDTGTPEHWRRFPSRLSEGVDRILFTLSETGHKATFFCLGWVAEKHPDWFIHDKDGKPLGRPLIMPLETSHMFGDLHMFGNSIGLTALPEAGPYEFEFEVTETNSDAKTARALSIQITE